MRAPKASSQCNEEKVSLSCALSKAAAPRQSGPERLFWGSKPRSSPPMCRNIKTLFNFEPPATKEEIRAASLQFVRKLSGFNAPSKANERAFNRAVDEVYLAARRMISALETSAPPRDREIEAQKARLRAAIRFGERR